MREEHVPVLIVGGGGAGLTASMLLARLGVDHLLVSARPGTSDLPKAHVLNQRAMEVLEDCGVADAIAARSTPAAQMAATAYYAGFAGPDADYGRRLARLEAWGAGGENEQLARGEPVAAAQPPADPARADPQGAAPSGSRRAASASTTSCSSSSRTTTACARVVRDNGTGEEYVVRCEYLLGADGGRRCAAQIGVSYEGLGVLTADRDAARQRRLLAAGRADPDVLIRWIASPQAGALVVMVPMGPERWGPDSEEWVIHLNYPADDPRAQSDEQVEADVRDALGLAGRCR